MRMLAKAVGCGLVMQLSYWREDQSGTSSFANRASEDKFQECVPKREPLGTDYRPCRRGLGNETSKRELGNE